MQVPPIGSVEIEAVRVSPSPEQAALRALQGEWVFVLVRSDDGLAGYGEGTHSGDDAALATLIRDDLGPVLIERSRSRGTVQNLTAGLLDTLRAAGDPRHSRVLATAASAVEQALWDLAARATGRPLHQALGGQLAAEPVALYATLNRGIFDRTPEGFARAARLAVSEGFHAVKCAPFDGVIRGGEPGAARRAAIELGIERAAAVREAIGDGVELMIDCHGRFTEPEAIEVAARLAGLRLRWLEEPVPFEPDPAPLARVRRASPVPIAAGELMFGVEAFRPLLDAGAADVLMPDVKHCGGLAVAREIAALAARYGVAIAPHNPSGPISTLASAHLCAALSNAPLLEYAWGEVPWRATLLEPAEAIDRGQLALPPGPGLGARLAGPTLATHRLSLGC
jgi:galactonate dehydratase